MGIFGWNCAHTYIHAHALTHTRAHINRHGIIEGGMNKFKQNSIRIFGASPLYCMCIGAKGHFIIPCDSYIQRILALNFIRCTVSIRLDVSSVATTVCIIVVVASHTHIVSCILAFSLTVLTPSTKVRSFTTLSEAFSWTGYIESSGCQQKSFENLLVRTEKIRFELLTKSVWFWGNRIVYQVETLWKYNKILKKNWRWWEEGIFGLKYKFR